MGNKPFLSLPIVQMQQPWLTATIHPTGTLHPLLFKFRALSPSKKGCHFLPEDFLTLLGAVVPSLNTYAHQFIHTT